MRRRNPRGQSADEGRARLMEMNWDTSWFDPVVRAIQMPRVSIPIADDVGLGKTIECGMTEMELVNATDSILCGCDLTTSAINV